MFKIEFIDKLFVHLFRTILHVKISINKKKSTHFSSCLNFEHFFFLNLKGSAFDSMELTGEIHFNANSFHSVQLLRYMLESGCFENFR